MLLGYDAPWTAADHVPEVMEFEPIGLETFDQRLVDNELPSLVARLEAADP